ncbi:MAG: Holliday junction resolvase RuvX [Endomicrobium sp.]|jgi:putative Holliday junction resolvase|nr:Holliday junction resolvase RuvX [Endomicrobium sp.]
MSRVMGVDYGLKRIGIAMTDILQVVASPFDIVESVSLKKDAVAIVDIAKNNDVSCIVFGLPINMNGTEGEMVESIHKVIEAIKSISDIDIVTLDERLTTAQAERLLIEEANLSRQKRKGLKDKIAASFILQTYLNMQCNKTI